MNNLYDLVQAGIYAGAVIIGTGVSVGIYAHARFEAENTRARAEEIKAKTEQIKVQAEADQIRVDQLKEALKDPGYQQFLDKRKAYAEYLNSEYEGPSVSEIENELDAVFGKTI